MAELFGVNVRTISEHLKNFFRTGELDEESVIRNFRITTALLPCTSTFRVRQDREFESDFDREVKRLLGKKEG